VDRGVLDRAVHPLDLAVRPRVRGLRQPVLDAELLARVLEGVHPPSRRLVVRRQGRVGRRERERVDELEAVVGEHRVDRVIV
jgi:hypothetical protein